jgi:hypothetical protein
MLTRRGKIYWLVGSLLAVAILFFGGIFGVRALVRSMDSYQVAVAYIRESAEIREKVGEITGFGFMPFLNVHTTGGFGEATFDIRVIGERDTVRVGVWLERVPSRPWEVVYTTW